MSEFKQQLWSMDMLPKDILIEKIKRLEQALKEIKKIAEEYEELHGFLDCTYELILEKCEVIDD